MTEELTEFIEDSLNTQLVKLIASHYHEDCTGGLAYLQNKGIESIANRMTVMKCKEEKLPIPSASFTDSLIVDFNGMQIECRYFGAGHTVDNTTVFIPEKQILFGGCLIKSLDSENLGYVGEAILEEWDSTVKKVKKKHGNAKIIVPGHGNYGGSELLEHTVKLVERHRLK
jgi:metallo-beta-lactamase class B